MFETYKAGFLHEPDLLYGYQYGVDLDEFCDQIDPLKQFQMMEIGTTGMIQTRYDANSCNNMLVQKRVYIAAAQLSNSLPFGLDPSLSVDELSELKLTSKAMAELTRRRSIYFSNRADGIPIVIDTGASMSVSPCEEDFIDLDKTKGNLSSLAGDAGYEGIGTVRWTVRDVFGSVRVIETRAYYVPSATIRLYSPQQYFQEHNAGELWSNARRTVLTLADGSKLEFPYNPGSNLPLMLPDWKPYVGFTYKDRGRFKDNADSVFLSVGDESNQNITTSQKELLQWHWRLGHANFKWIQRLASTPRKSLDGMEGKPILRTRNQRVSSCPTPLCAACQMSKQTRRNPEVKIGSPIPEKEMSLKRGNLQPGDMVSIDQYVSTVPGRLPKTYGKEPKKDKYTGGTLFVDHATGYIYLGHQVSLRVGETLQTKHAFERFAMEAGVKIKRYRADNVPFGAREFTDDLDLQGQTISYSGSGAHHQNGVAERAIQTVTQFARAMLLHACIHWPDNTNLELWPFALEYAIWIWNNMPNRDSLLAPMELFTSSKFPSYAHLHRAHVFGCPAYTKWCRAYNMA
jgi:hypothetical protein